MVRSEAIPVSVSPVRYGALQSERQNFGQIIAYSVVLCYITGLPLHSLIR